MATEDANKVITLTHKTRQGFCLSVGRYVERTDKLCAGSIVGFLLSAEFISARSESVSSLTY